MSLHLLPYTSQNGQVTVMLRSFWSYELTKGYFADANGIDNHTALKVLFCGGVAGVVTWASIFPLDVIKTRMQTQTSPGTHGEQQPLLSDNASRRPTVPKGTWIIAREAYQEGGVRIFFRGLGVCSARAFVVNAVQVCSEKNI